MQLILFRHGEAGRASRDFDRCLTDHGIIEVRKTAAFAEDILAGAVAYVSPYIRARQTCDEIQRNVELQSVQGLDLITPDDEPEAVIEWLKLNARQDRPLLLVSHQPLVGRLLSLLVDGQEGGFYPMATASVAVLQADVWGRGLARLERLIHAVELE